MTQEALFDKYKRKYDLHDTFVFLGDMSTLNPRKVTLYRNVARTFAMLGVAQENIVDRGRAKYRCSYCSKRFIYHDEMKMHVFKEHPEFDSSDNEDKSNSSDSEFSLGGSSSSSDNEEVEDIGRNPVKSARVKSKNKSGGSLEEQLLQKMTKGIEGLNPLEAVQEDLEEAQLFKCLICETECKGCNEYFMHLKLHDFTCLICMMTFVKSIELDNHMIVKHKSVVELDKQEKAKTSPNLNYKQDESLRYQCNVCQQRFGDCYQLKRHKAVHPNAADPKFPCVYCRSKFASEAEVKSHYFAMHYSKMNPEGIRKVEFPCEFCEKKFSSDLELMVHYSSKHSIEIKKTRGDTVQPNDQKLYACNFCNKVFGTVQDIIIHYKSIHYDVLSRKKFSCSKCDAVFTKEHEANTHYKLMHLKPIAPKEPKGVKTRYQCKYCEFSFRSKEYFQSHSKAVHGVNITFDSDKPIVMNKAPAFSCPICDDVFSTKELLTRHEGNAHRPKQQPIVLNKQVPAALRVLMPKEKAVDGPTTLTTTCQVTPILSTTMTSSMLTNTITTPLLTNTITSPMLSNTLTAPLMSTTMTTPMLTTTMSSPMLTSTVSSTQTNSGTTPTMFLTNNEQGGQNQIVLTDINNLTNYGYLINSVNNGIQTFTVVPQTMLNNTNVIQQAQPLNQTFAPQVVLPQGVYNNAQPPVGQMVVQQHVGLPTTTDDIPHTVTNASLPPQTQTTKTQPVINSVMKTSAGKVLLNNQTKVKLLPLSKNPNDSSQIGAKGCSIGGASGAAQVLAKGSTQVGVVRTSQGFKSFRTLQNIDNPTSTTAREVGKPNMALKARCVKAYALNAKGIRTSTPLTFISSVKVGQKGVSIAPSSGSTATGPVISFRGRSPITRIITTRKVLPKPSSGGDCVTSSGKSSSVQKDAGGGNRPSEEVPHSASNTTGLSNNPNMINTLDLADNPRLSNISGQAITSGLPNTSALPNSLGLPNTTALCNTTAEPNTSGLTVRNLLTGNINSIKKAATSTSKGLNTNISAGSTEPSSGGSQVENQPGTSSATSSGMLYTAPDSGKRGNHAPSSDTIEIVDDDEDLPPLEVVDEEGGENMESPVPCADEDDDDDSSDSTDGLTIDEEAEFRPKIFLKPLSQLLAQPPRQPDQLRQSDDGKQPNLGKQANQVKKPEEKKKQGRRMLKCPDCIRVMRKHRKYENHLNLNKCNLCDFRSCKTPLLVTHNKTAHPEAMNCVLCHTRFASEELLEAHGKEKHFCSGCKSSIIKNLDEHSVQHKCWTCDYKTCRYSQLCAHLHDDHKVYHCWKCKKFFTDIKQFGAHNTEFHSCPKCGLICYVLMKHVCKKE